MRLRLAGFSGMLLITMAASTISFFALAVASTDLQDEFGISKLQLGLLGAINTGVGGAFAPMSGRLADRYGGRWAMGGVLVTAGIGASVIALAQSFGAAMVGMAIAGLPQGWGNPATNKAISRGVAASQRGILTGLKQSGVQLAVFTSGFAMPAISGAWGWRAGLWMAAAISFSALLGLRLVPTLTDDEIAEVSLEQSAEQPEEPEQTTNRETVEPAPLPRFVYQVAIFGFLLGAVGGGLGRFLPLFAEEVAGFSVGDAGRVFGIQGLVAVPTRIASGILLDRGVSPRRMITTMGVGGAVAVVLILLATDGSGAFLWSGTVLAGLTLGSWNTAANLSMVRENRSAGRASGILMIGFLAGLTFAGPAVGWSIDTFDSYTPAWLASAGFALTGAAIVSRRLDGPDRYP
ncbi:MAG: MFS transporter [Acidimicrobiales bacterium]